MPQFIDVKARVNLGNPEVRVAVDRQRAADLGVRVSDLANALRLMVSGEDEITSFREDGERYPVKMRVREDQRNDVDAVGGLTVQSRNGGLVRIDNVSRLDARRRSDLHHAPRPSIRRRRIRRPASGAGTRRGDPGRPSGDPEAEPPCRLPFTIRRPGPTARRNGRGT